MPPVNPKIDLSNVPDAPPHFPAEIALQWKTAYVKALAQAKIDTPDNDRAQRIAALKQANKMLSVPAPQSASDIDALPAWQVIKRSTVNGVSTVITTDGRKYSFPVGSGN